jgi:hypothetical protein
MGLPEKMHTMIVGAAFKSLGSPILFPFAAFAGFAVLSLWLDRGSTFAETKIISLDEI